jgi:succinate dehydrogenase / fumarate reductase membrane anchor subunit
MNYRTPLGRARGLGSAGQGSHEWWRQRVTSVALIPLTFWFAASVALLPGLDYEQALQWIAAPWNGILLLAFIILTAYHSLLGVQVVVEDYVHTDWIKLLSLLVLRLVFYFLTIAAVYATLRLLFAD